LSASSNSSPQLTPEAVTAAAAAIMAAASSAAASMGVEGAGGSMAEASDAGVFGVVTGAVCGGGTTW